MDSLLYDNIIKTILDYEGLTIDCLKNLIEKFPNVSKDTLRSILSQEYQKLMRHRHDKSPATVSKFFNLYNEAVGASEDPGIILRMGIRHKISPCLIAKLILLRKYQDGVHDESALQTNVTSLMRNSSLIDDKVLSHEVFLCTLYDDQYSPLVELMKTSLGQQYEIFLHRKLTELKLGFRDEEYLRKSGYDKTPDFKLDVPVMSNGFIIHWIESKALFGDADTHREYFKNQYSSYLNRFGSGLVIYWFGYSKSIITVPIKNLMISDKIPDIQQLE